MKPIAVVLYARALLYFVFGGMFIKYANIFAYPPLVFVIGIIAIIYGCFRIYRVWREQKSI